MIILGNGQVQVYDKELKGYRLFENLTEYENFKEDQSKGSINLNEKLIEKDKIINDLGDTIRNHIKAYQKLDKEFINFRKNSIKQDIYYDLLTDFEKLHNEHNKLLERRD